MFVSRCGDVWSNSWLFICAFLVYVRRRSRLLPHKALYCAMIRCAILWCGNSAVVSNRAVFADEQVLHRTSKVCASWVSSVGADNSCWKELFVEKLHSLPKWPYRYIAVFINTINDHITTLCWHISYLYTRIIVFTENYMLLLGISCSHLRENKLGC